MNPSSTGPFRLRLFALMAPPALAFSLMSGVALAPTSARAEAPEGETRYLCCSQLGPADEAQWKRRL